ncbi:MAG TPA: cytochrome c [Vicinamibacterales bacterium]|jgi:mono/diheme cytochrome c family protein
MYWLRSKGIRLAGSLAAAALTVTLLWGPVRAQGKSASDIYLDKCSVCHGADGAAKTAKGKKLKVKDVRETVAKLSPEQMTEIVTKGKAPNMDGYAKDFSADQIKQIVEYYRSLAKR